MTALKMLASETKIDKDAKENSFSFAFAGESPISHGRRFDKKIYKNIPNFMLLDSKLWLTKCTSIHGYTMCA